MIVILVKQIEKLEKDIDIISAPGERFRSVLESMTTGSKHLVFTEKESKVELPTKQKIGLSLLSSGDKQLLFIPLHALIGSNHCLIIDKPELSMHVDWQKKLVATLRDLNPKLQLIMATHAPDHYASVSVLSRPSKRQVTRQFPIWNVVLLWEGAWKIFHSRLN